MTLSDSRRASGKERKHTLKRKKTKWKARILITNQEDYDYYSTREVEADTIFEARRLLMDFYTVSIEEGRIKWFRIVRISASEEGSIIKSIPKDPVKTEDYWVAEYEITRLDRSVSSITALPVKATTMDDAISIINARLLSYYMQGAFLAYAIREVSLVETNVK